MKDYFFSSDVGVKRVSSPDTVWVAPGTQPIGSLFTEYVIGHEGFDSEILGSGSVFGPVVAATLKDGSPVAIKLFLPLKPEYNRDYLYDHASHEFRRGKQDLGPHFVRAYALLESQDHRGRPIFLLVMQLIRGKSLEVALRDVNVESENQVRFMRQVLEALATLQLESLVWQDIKPANIMLEGDDLAQANLVFIDHGSVRKTDAGTFTNSQYTEGYVAPEMLAPSPTAASHKFTHASDIFSAGVTLLSFFTNGQPYIDGDRRFRTIYSTPNLKASNLDSRVRDTLAGMLVRNPQDRASLSDLMYVLEGTPPRGWNPDPYSSYEASNVGPGSAFPVDEEEDEVREDRNSGFAQNVRDESFAKSKPIKPTVPYTATMKQSEVDLIPPIPTKVSPGKESRLLNFAGVDSQWVESRERAQYGAIGVALIVYFIYICLGAAAVGWQATESVIVALVGGFVFGPLLGAALVNLDRTIVATVSSDLNELHNGTTDSPIRRTPSFWVGMIVRVSIAVIAAFLIGEAINVQIHEKDVSEFLQGRQEEEVTNAYIAIDNNWESVIAESRQQVDTAKSNRDSVENKETEYLKMARDEAEGLGVTQRPTCGPECKKYIKKAEEAAKRWNAQSATLNKAVSDAENDLRSREEEALKEKRDTEAAIKSEVSGPMARSRALIEVARSDWLTGVKYVALVVLFMAIELTAILIKLLTLNSAYEREMARQRREREYSFTEDAGLRHHQIQLISSYNQDLISDSVWVQAAKRHVVVDRQARTVARSLGIEVPFSSFRQRRGQSG